MNAEQPLDATEAIYDMIANGVSVTATGDIEISLDLPARLRAYLAASPATGEVTEEQFPYTRTFHAIAAAVQWKPDRSIGISVRKFQEAFGPLSAPAPAARECASEGCSNAATMRFECDDVGSEYCCECYKQISIDAFVRKNPPTDAPTPATPADGTVYVDVSGLTGTGKSAVMGEIEIALRAIGLTVEHDPDFQSEKNMTHAEWQEALDLYKPTVVLRERNISRAAQGKQP